MAAFLDGCRFLAVSSGTGDFVVASAAPGCMTPAQAGAVNAMKYKYHAESADKTQWEDGEGAYTVAGTTLARTTVLYNSSGTTAKIPFAAAPQVAIVALKEDLLSISEANAFSTTQQTQAATNLLIPTGAGAQAFTAAQQAQVRSNIGVNYLPHSNGFLTVSGANIILNPLYGNVLSINGINATIPDAGVTLAPTGLTVSTLYYVYAVQTSGVVTSLEASTTTHVMSTTAGSQGQRIKTGDATRLLVGMVRPITGPAFSDLPAQRFVRSWLNRDRLQLRGTAFSGTTTSTTTAGVEISTTARMEFLIWADEAADISTSGTTYNTTAGQSTYSTIAFDGTAEAPLAGGGSSTANQDITATLRIVKTGLSEGYHYTTVFGKVSAGTGTWYAGSFFTMMGTIK